ncbi:hypothetical protein B0H11DRAFT_2030280 [Mycena galericulata]|nr:hypothetical protein B0H11DRAFT_2030280 [Mycena galericulata]
MQRCNWCLCFLTGLASTQLNAATLHTYLLCPWSTFPLISEFFALALSRFFVLGSEDVGQVDVPTGLLAAACDHSTQLEAIGTPLFVRIYMRNQGLDRT